MAQKKKKSSQTPRAVVNRRARFDYELGDETTTGLSLTGPEVRAARDGHVQLKGAYVTTRGGELWLNNASFSLTLNQKGQPGARTIDTSPKKLLAHRKEIDALIARRKDGLTIIPLRLLTAGRFIKVVIALGKGKKLYDKRETLKRREQERDTQRAIKHF